MGSSNRWPSESALVQKVSEFVSLFVKSLYTQYVGLIAYVCFLVTINTLWRIMPICVTADRIPLTK